MKILILTTIMAPYRINLFNELGKYCNLTVCFEQQTDESRNEKWYSENIINFKAIRLKGWEKSINKIKLETLKIIDTIKPDICVAYEYSTVTSILFILKCIRKNIPYCINCDGAFIKNKSYKDIIKQFAIKNASGCLANGEWAKKYFEYYGAESEDIYNHKFSTLYKSDIIERRISLQERLKLKSELGITSEKIILSVGQFIHRKGYDILLKASKYIEHNDVAIYIIGGKATDEYKKLRNTLGLKNVYFLDFKSKEDLNKYYQIADIFVLPTREDIWGLVINEAMSQGLPIITTERCIAGLELVKNGKNGFIVPIENSILLSQKINYILNDENLILSMGNNSLNLIEDYTIENIANSHMETFKSILAKQKRGEI